MRKKRVMRLNVKKEKLKKRKWIYIQSPTAYECHCDLCGGNNITWSEYQHMFWCYDCQKDTSGFLGIFDGPIPLEVSKLLGICFDRIHLKTGRIMNMVSREGSGKLIWKFDKSALGLIGIPLMYLEVINNIYQKMRKEVFEIKV